MCHACFGSRSKLFAHIRESGHAAAQPVTHGPDGEARRAEQDAEDEDKDLAPGTTPAGKKGKKKRR